MRYRQANSYLASPSKIFQTLYIKIQAQIAFNRSDFSPNNQRQIYKDFGIATVFCLLFEGFFIWYTILWSTTLCTKEKMFIFAP